MLRKDTPISAENTHDTISRWMLEDAYPFVMDLEKSVGSRIWDSKGGRFILDLYSQTASQPIGYNHPKLSDPDFERKLLRAAKCRPANSHILTVEMAEFVDTFSRLAMPACLPHVFFIDGGALAVENAMKAAFDWKVKKNFKKYGDTKERGHQIIHFKEAFHGRGGYTTSITNTTDPKKYQYYPLFPWPRIAPPKAVFPLTGENLSGTIKREEEAVLAIRSVFTANPDHVAAIIIETIQAEGGDNHFRPEFHLALRSLCDEFDAMLIYDEVQSGFGLTGKMWAYQNYPVRPDMVSFGKKSQVCGFMCGRRVEENEKNVFTEPSRINSTWGGNLVDMVRSQRYLEIIHEEGLIENAAVVGKYLQGRLAELERSFPDLISNVRGQGLMCAFDLSTGEKREKLIDRAYTNGALIFGCGTRSIRFRPVLDFTRANVDELYGILDQSLREI